MENLFVLKMESMVSVFFLTDVGIVSNTVVRVVNAIYIAIGTLQLTMM